MLKGCIEGGDRSRSSSGRGALRLADLGGIGGASREGEMEGDVFVDSACGEDRTMFDKAVGNDTLRLAGWASSQTTVVEYDPRKFGEDLLPANGPKGSVDIGTGGAATATLKGAGIGLGVISLSVLGFRNHSGVAGFELPSNSPLETFVRKSIS